MREKRERVGDRTEGVRAGAGYVFFFFLSSCVAISSSVVFSSGSLLPALSPSSSAPTGVDLSRDGSNVAVSQNGVGSFFRPVSANFDD